MPNMDKTGPEGQGATGSGRGSCPNKDKNNTFTRQGGGCRQGSGRSRQGCGMRVGRFNLSKKDEKNFLEEEMKETAKQLQLLKNRIDELND